MGELVCRVKERDIESIANRNLVRLKHASLVKVVSVIVRSPVVLPVL
jgi:hypothetical protein